MFELYFMIVGVVFVVCIFKVCKAIVRLLDAKSREIEISLGESEEVEEDEKEAKTRRKAKR